MISRSHAFLASAAIAIIALTIGCGKATRNSSGAPEPKITGKPSDPPVSLQVNWQPGSRYVMRMEMKENSDAGRGRGQGRGGSQQTSLAHEYAVIVTNAPESGKRGLDVELLSIEVEETMGGRTLLTYDSQNRVVGTGGNPAAEALARMIGGRIRFLVDADNKVLAEQGMNDLLARANQPGTNNTTQGGRFGGGGGNRGFASGGGGIVARQGGALENFKQMLALSVLPQGEFRVGDTWPAQFEITAGGPRPIVVAGTNLFRGWQEHERKKCARIEFTGTVGGEQATNSAGSGNFRGGRRGGGGMMMLSQGTISGVCWIDPGSGLPTEVSVEQALTRSGAFGGRGRQGTNGPAQSFSAQQRQTFSVKLIESTLLSAN